MFEEFAHLTDREPEQRYLSRDILYAVHGAIIPKVYRHSRNTCIKKGVKSICGYQITVEELVTMIEKNRSIYTLNRGGVTLTGGEPLFQPDFVIELLRQLPDIHTAIETSGYANTHIFNEVTSLADLILFDIKHTDPEMHRKYTGVDNAIILENLALLCNSGTKFYHSDTFNSLGC